jgi:hypothetical protein
MRELDHLNDKQEAIKHSFGLLFLWAIYETSHMDC